MKSDIINDQPEYSGTGVYAWNLYRMLKGSDSFRFVYYNHREGRCDFMGPDGTDRTIAVRRGRLKPLFWKRCSGAYQHQDNVHILSQNLSFLRPGKRRIVTCLDLIPLIMPGSLWEKYWRRLLYSGLKKADHIISISQATKDDLVRIYGIDPAKITPVMLGVSQEYHPRDKKECRTKLGLPADARLILHVGTPAPRKNFIAVLKAFKSISSLKGISLVKVGAVSDSEERFMVQNGIRDKVIIRDRVEKADLPFYYAGADVLAFPSIYEGFGLPVLEAMASGCPVVASNTTSIPEVAGNAAILIDPYDRAGLGGKMSEILDDPNLSEKLARKGVERANDFTWERTAKETVEVYKKVFV